jgi:hypothetical protein
MRMAPESRPNPFRDPAARPAWAQLTRLAGDRAAILFEELRRQLGRIDGVQEELHYDGAGRGWVPRYRVKENILCAVQISPGLLEARIELESALREKLLAWPRVSGEIKRTLRGAALDMGIASLRLRLRNRSDVRSLANLAGLKNKFSSSDAISENPLRT